MHVIRLHGPWTAEVTGPDGTTNRRVHLPREWPVLAELVRESNVTLLRRFHRPTGLHASTRVSLAVPAGWPIADVTVNQSFLNEKTGSGELRRFDLSEVIQSQEAHDLRIEFRRGVEMRDAVYFVAIEITEPLG
jgi:hypothetical protein